MRHLRLLLAALAVFSPASAGQKAVAVSPLTAAPVAVRSPTLPQTALTLTPAVIARPASIQEPVAALVQAQQVSSAFTPRERQASPQQQAHEAARRFDGHHAIGGTSDAPAVRLPSARSPVPFALVAHAASTLHRDHVDRPRVERLLSKAMRGLLEKGGATTFRAARPHFQALRQALSAPAMGMGFSWSKPLTGAAFVTRVDRGSPAYEAGLQPMDRIIAADGRPTRTLHPHELRPLLEKGERTLLISRQTREGELRFETRVSVGFYRQPDFSRLMPEITRAFQAAAAMFSPAAAPALLDAALFRMASSLDRHTEYLDPEATREFAKHYEQPTYGGFGVQMDAGPDGRPLVGAVMPGSPAARAGLRAGDRVVTVDGEPVASLDPAGLSERVRREVGGTVRMRLERDGRPFSVTMQAEALDVPLTGAAMLPGKVGYVYMSSFSKPAAADLKVLLAMLRMEGARKLVIDLRFNPGGRLDVAVDLAGAFLPIASPITRLTYASRGPEQSVALGDGSFSDTQVAVVVNGESASASELFAGALRGNGRAVVVGEPTFGKGVGQEMRPLLGERTLKLTTFRWHLPDGRVLEQGDGIRPDVAVPTNENAKKSAFAAISKGLFSGVMPGLEDPAIKAAWDALAAAP